MKRDNKPFVEVSQHSRDIARRSPAAILAKLREELEVEKKEKRVCDLEIVDTEAWRKGELLKIASSHITKSDSIRATLFVDQQYHDKRKLILRRLYACEDGIRSLKSRLSKAPQEESARDRRDKSQLACLERIEILLKRIVQNVKE